MINNTNYPVHFGAKHIQTLKYTDKHTFSHEKVAFVEINPKSTLDTTTIKTLTNEWNDAPYVKAIHEDVLELRKEKPKINSKIFALTKQNKNYKNLESRQILGIVEVSNKNKQTAYIEYLQVDPLMKKARVGTNILNILKQMHNSIELHSADSALEFYTKNGFEIIDHIRLGCKWIKTEPQKSFFRKFI